MATTSRALEIECPSLRDSNGENGLNSKKRSAVAQRVKRFTHELNEMLHDDNVDNDWEATEQRAVHVVGLLLTLLSKVPLPEDIVREAQGAVINIMTSILHLPSETLDRFLDRTSLDLGLTQYLNSRGQSPHAAVVFLRHRDVHLDHPIPVETVEKSEAEVKQDKKKNTAVTTTPVVKAGPSPSPSLTSPSNAVVDEVLRGIDDLKRSAQNFRQHMAHDEHLLDTNQKLMEKAVLRTVDQSNGVAKIAGEDKNSAASRLSIAIRQSAILSRVPGLVMVIEMVLVPLWALVKHIVVVLMVILVTLGTLWMIMMVPRAYVRVVTSSSS